MEALTNWFNESLHFTFPPVSSLDEKDGKTMEVEEKVNRG